MSAEGELLQQIRAALARADLDEEGLVDEAWAAARAEVRAVLQRAFQHELLGRVAEVIEGEGPAMGSDTGARPAAPPETARSAAEPEDAEPSAAAPTAAESGVATYVFGITRAAAELDADLPRVPGCGAVRALDAGELRAVVCDADPDALRALEQLGPDDLDHLAAVAHAHDEVLARMAAQAPVVPLRLGTVLTDDDVVRDLLQTNRSSLTAELDRVEGHAEWAVVVRVPDGAMAEDGSDAAATGGDYLRGRQAELSARERRWEARERLAEELHERLSTFAVAADVVERRPLEQVPPALHGVYLLAWDRIGPFEDAVDEARSAYPEAVIEATGPWPPYHFTSVDLRFEQHAS